MKKRNYARLTSGLVGLFMASSLTVGQVNSASAAGAKPGATNSTQQKMNTKTLRDKEGKLNFTCTAHGNEVDFLATYKEPQMTMTVERKGDERRVVIAGILPNGKKNFVVEVNGNGNKITDYNDKGEKNNVPMSQETFFLVQALYNGVKGFAEKILFIIPSKPKGVAHKTSAQQADFLKKEMKQLGDAIDRSSGDDSTQNKLRMNVTSRVNPVYGNSPAPAS